MRSDIDEGPVASSDPPGRRAGRARRRVALGGVAVLRRVACLAALVLAYGLPSSALASSAGSSGAHGAIGPTPPAVFALAAPVMSAAQPPWRYWGPPLSSAGRAALFVFAIVAAAGMNWFAAKLRAGRVATERPPAVTEPATTAPASAELVRVATVSIAFDAAARERLDAELGALEAQMRSEGSASRYRHLSRLAELLAKVEPSWTHASVESDEPAFAAVARSAFMRAKLDARARTLGAGPPAAPVGESGVVVVSLVVALRGQEPALVGGDRAAVRRLVGSLATVPHDRVEDFEWVESSAPEARAAVEGRYPGIERL